jgi:hypothetical protein
MKFNLINIYTEKIKDVEIKRKKDRQTGTEKETKGEKVRQKTVIAEKKFKITFQCKQRNRKT